ncbi:hypothetical protein GCM10022209_30430 [Chitinophaga oryziterrae]
MHVKLVYIGNGLRQIITCIGILPYNISGGINAHSFTTKFQLVNCKLLYSNTAMANDIIVLS